MTIESSTVKATSDTTTNVSRRRFLKYAIGGAAGAAVMALHGHTFITGINSNTTLVDSLEQMGKEFFTKHLGDTFIINKSAFETVSLQLDEAKDIVFDNAGRIGLAFSLLFKGPDSIPLEQDTYIVTNEVIGSFPLFLVPVYSETQSLYYEAVFNRLES